MCVGIFPAWEGRASVIATVKAVLGKGADPGVVVEGMRGDGDSGTGTPDKKSVI